MLSADTKYFGQLTYTEESVYEFPFGLPAFEDERQFVLIESAPHAPLVFLQSLAHQALCFLAFPILIVDRGYQLGIAREDLGALGLDPERQPALGSQVLVLTPISLHDKFSATANLMAPIVVNLKTRRGLQAIRQDAVYSHQHPVQPAAAGEAC